MRRKTRKKIRSHIYFEEERENLIYKIGKTRDSHIECIYCGSIRLYKHGGDDITLKDVPQKELPVLVKIYFDRYKCNNCKKTFPDQLECRVGQTRVTRRFFKKCLDLIDEGYSQMDIANKMFISEVTLRSYLTKHKESFLHPDDAIGEIKETINK